MKRKEFLATSLAGAGLLMGYPLLYGNSAFDAFELKDDPGKRYVLKEGDRVPPDELRMLAGYLKSYSIPQGVLQPGGGWTAVYDILTFSTTRASQANPDNVMSNAVLGQVAISRLKNKNEFIVRMVYEPLNRKEELLARIICNDDAMLSLKSWELDWTSNPVYASHERGEVNSGSLIINDGIRTESFPCSKPLACLWTTIDAVRNLPAGRFATKEFNMYMDLSSLQYNHFLDYSGKKSCPVGNTDMYLTFYRHLGVGINPIHYAVDQQQRTLFVTHGQLGWALNKIVEDKS